MQKIPRIFNPWLLHGITTILIFLFFLGTRHWPLISSPGFEAANLFVCLFAPWFAFIATLTPRLSHHRDFLGGLSFQLILGGLNILFYTLLLWANTYEQQSCSLGVGFAPFFVILLPPFFLAITLGILIASLVYRLWLRILILIIVYALYFSFVIYSWWLNPGFRILTHASVLLSSDLLEGQELNLAIIGFRSATFLLALGIALFGIIFLTRYPHLRIRTIKKFASVILILLVLSLALLFHRESLLMLGKNRNQLFNDYSLSITKNGITVRANPQALSHAETQAILDEALLFKQRINHRLGPASDKEITIFLHKDRHDKFLYTGAKNVHFAEANHREIHISGYEIPHPVLGHELAHIFVGEYANTLWGAPGSYGIIPNLALTEGLAMALTEELNIDNDLSLLEQARALYQAGFTVNHELLFSDNPLTFISNNVRSSYIFSGAFIQFILRDFSLEQRREALQKIIKRGSLEKYFFDDEKLKQAFIQFNAYLNEPVPGFAILWAKNNFTPHSILSTDCRDNYRKEKESFSRFLLNDEIKPAVEAIEILPPNIKTDFLLFGFSQAIEQNDYEKALLLSSAAALLMLKENDQRINELWLKEAGIYFFQNEPQKAALVLQNVDEKYLDLPLKRQFIIMQEFLLSPTPAEQAELIRALNLALLDNSPSKTGSLIQLSYALGKCQSLSSPVYYVAQYLYARMLWRTHHYREGLMVMKNLNKNPKWLPQAIMDENNAMMAYTLTALKQYDDAKNAYEHMLKNALRPSEIIAIKDSLERIIFTQASAK